MKLATGTPRYFRLKRHPVNRRWFIQVGRWVLWLNKPDFNRKR